MDIQCYVEIPADKLPDAVRLAYDYSQPQGLGILHAKPGALGDEEVQAIMARGNDRIAVSMDYVLGRSCKFHVYRQDERLFVSPRWYDHGDWQLEDLLAALGVEDPPGKIAAAIDAMRLANEKWERENPR